MARRVSREPLQYELGEWDFDLLRGLIVRQPVLIPRPETEELVAMADSILKAFTGIGDGSRGLMGVCGVTHRPMPPVRFLEVGCGSGAISLSLVARARARGSSSCTLEGTAIDISAAAVALTRENARAQGVGPASLAVLHCSLEHFSPAGGHFSLLVSNPPYIPPRDMQGLQQEVRDWEDERALDGGEPGGLDVILRLLQSAAAGRWMEPGGIALLEVHTTHPPLLHQMLTHGDAYALPYTLLPPFGCSARSPVPSSEEAGWRADQDLAEAVRAVTVGELGGRLRAAWRWAAAISDMSGRPRFVALHSRGVGT